MRRATILTTVALYAAFVAFSATIGEHGYAYAPRGTAVGPHHDGPPAGRLPLAIETAFDGTGATVRESVFFEFGSYILGMLRTNHNDKTAMIFAKIFSRDLFEKILERVSHKHNVHHAAQQRVT